MSEAGLLRNFWWRVNNFIDKNKEQSQHGKLSRLGIGAQSKGIQVQFQKKEEKFSAW